MSYTDSRLQPFDITVPPAELELLRRRLADARWPDQETVTDHSQGIPLAEVRRLCERWLNGYDWRSRERDLNQIEQVRTEIDGLGLHAAIWRSGQPDAMPLVLTHGWPGVFVEFADVAARLAAPERFGDDGALAFHVVCPSLPGYGFSDRPDRSGWGVEQIADAWAELMARLGFVRFGAAGCDWGTTISAELGRRHSSRVVGAHLVPPLVAPDLTTLGELTDTERQALEDLRRAHGGEAAYSLVHAHAPQTIGFSLVDSPVGLAAWMLEKFWAWSDHDGDLYQTIDIDRILDILTIHWVTATGASAVRLYWESFPAVLEMLDGAPLPTVDVPIGGSVFPRERRRMSRRWAQRRFPDIRYWNELHRGGHFPALEQPDVLADEFRSFFGRLS